LWSFSSSNSWHCYGLRHQKKRTLLLAVWRLEGRTKTFTVPLDFLNSRRLRVQQLYPAAYPPCFILDRRLAALRVSLDRPLSARLLRVEY
jgi:hypothetical protein